MLVDSLWDKVIRGHGHTVLHVVGQPMLWNKEIRGGARERRDKKEEVEEEQ